MNYQLSSSWLLPSPEDLAVQGYRVCIASLFQNFRIGFCKTLKEFHSMNSIAKFSKICSQFPQAFFTTFLQSIKYKLAQTSFKKNILLYLKKRYMTIRCLSQKWHCLGNIHSNSKKEKTYIPASFTYQDYVPIPDVLRSYPPICY